METHPNPFKLPLDRPLAVFDIEATGLDRRRDRIIDLAIVKFWPDGRREHYRFLLNPGIPIPPEATAIHGITDEMVKDKPSFKEVAAQVLEILRDCDLAGYNVLGFDIPLLVEEFARAGITFEVAGRRVIDAQRIFHKKVPRDLPAALAYYCGEMHLDAHDAFADVEATIRVLAAQLDRYPDLPRNVEGLNAFCQPGAADNVDRAGKFKWVNGQIVFNFGPKRGQPLAEVARTDPGFLNWMLQKKDFDPDTQQIVREALAGRLRTRPSG